MGTGTMYFLLQLLPAELGHQLSGSKKAERLVKAGPWGIYQKHPLADPGEGKGSNHISWTGSHQL